MIKVMAAKVGLEILVLLAAAWWTALRSGSTTYEPSSVTFGIFYYFEVAIFLLCHNLCHNQQIPLIDLVVHCSAGAEPFPTRDAVSRLRYLQHPRLGNTSLVDH